MPPNRPLLSVLMPAYNAERFIKQALQSLLIQSYTNLEILVCDDGSSDKTIAEVESIKDPRVRLFKNEKNSGKNATANHLLELAAGEYISVHDADDISVPLRFERQMDFLLEHPSCVLCGTNFVSFLGNGKIIDKSHLELESGNIRNKIGKESQFHGPTIVFKKSIVSQVGGLYRYFDQPSDIDFTMRVAERFETANLQEYLYLYRHVPSSITNRLDGYDMKRLGDAKLLYHLAEERRNNDGVDSLMKGDPELIARLMKEFTREYQADPSIALRRGVFRLLGMRMYKNALVMSVRALLLERSVLNIKCFVYTIIHTVKGEIEVLFIRERVNLDFLIDKKD